MRPNSLLSSVFSLALLPLALEGCSVEADDTGADGDAPIGEFQEGQGQLPYAQPTYPSRAEWGTGEQKVVPNWTFIGYANSEDPALAGVQQFSLADFYNPNGYEYAACVKGGATDCATRFPDALFPQGSPWGAGLPKPRALSVGQSAVWCGPCNQEAKSLLPGKYKEYQPMGGQFLIGLVDGPKPGISATISDITKWTQKYDVGYPLVTDPNGFLPQLFPPSLPSNAVIRTSDMKILVVAAGAPEESGSAVCKQYPNEPACKYWSVFEKALESAN
ncbi:MAG: hypothetical protein FJ096_00120 [Deltaproteobacteria bacterium]|nr:hypothetical protein [Deltaproteobacteria bacterium]